jgi:hypothetical protein
MCSSCAEGDVKCLKLRDGDVPVLLDSTLEGGMYIFSFLHSFGTFNLSFLHVIEFPSYEPNHTTNTYFSSGIDL